MALKMVDVILSGTTRVTATHTPVKQVIIHNPAGNASVTIGPSTMSATAYGILVAAGANSPSLGPFAGELPFNLEDVYLRGTDTQTVHVLYIT